MNFLRDFLRGTLLSRNSLPAADSDNREVRSEPEEHRNDFFSMVRFASRAESPDCNATLTTAEGIAHIRKAISR